MRQNYLDRMMTARDRRYHKIAARLSARPAAATAKLAEPLASAPDADLEAARAAYLETFGRAPDGRWKAETLRDRIANATTSREVD
jgi:nitrate reductase assembly molybdenum cofactor insertion protein NarJ